ncbi:hypothetical protein SLS64_007149 [Diaporthe eres]
MMTYFLSTLFISVVCANPLKSPDQPLVRARNDLEACRQAINCEIVDPQTRNETNSSLARIRYKPTMGPESMFYRDLIARQPQNHKRDDDGTIETQVTLADAKVGYGAVKKTSPGNTDYSHCKAIKQTGEYHVSRWVWIDGNRVLQGFIVAKVSIPEEEKGMCDALGPLITAGEMAGAIPEIGEVIAGIFGAISAVVSHFIC